MPWKLNVHANLGFIETVYQGVVTEVELRRAIGEKRSAQQATGFARFLSDCSHLEGGHSLADLYFLAKDLMSSADSKGIRDALIMPAGPARELVQFWETTGSSLGLDVRAFENRDDALRWLVE